MNKKPLPLDEQDIVTSLEEVIQHKTINHHFKEVYRYALLPPGKLFRPKLTIASFEDAIKHSKLAVSNNTIKNLKTAACFLEIHHAYTLIHDDLPCMDNDDFRRGRPSTHKKFGQWQALLAGDGLLNLSYHLLFSIDHPQIALFGRYASKMLGPSGLIHGQTLDLSKESEMSFNILKETHLLKTARLIQVSLLLGYLLSENSHQSIIPFKKLHFLGEKLGLAFQFLDDLTELNEPLTEHEKTINPWINKHYTECQLFTLNLLSSIENFFKTNHSPCLQNTVSWYFDKTLKAIAGENLSNTLKEYHKGINQKETEKNLVLLKARLELLSKINQSS